MLRGMYALLGLTLVAGVVGCGGKDEMAREAARRMAYDSSASMEPHQGIGPQESGDKYDRIVENEFLAVDSNPLSTFSIDVDTASYSKVRMLLLQANQLPPADAVRIEELINYFDYAYKPPTDSSPFAARIDAASCPWNEQHRLVRIGLKGREVDSRERPPSNLVFLIDVSGSMAAPNKLPLLKHGLRMLVEQLDRNDRVSIVVYASATGEVLPSTPGNRKADILFALERLDAGGSTNGGAGISLAYQTARDNFIPGGVNRVILCTDGDFNVGATSNAELVRMVENNAKDKISLSVLGFGTGNHNDSMMEQISNNGDGNYAFIDTSWEARKVLVEQISGTLVTIAKDVKIQVEFNPTQVSHYRLIGYENRLLADEDFNDDQKDAGDIGAGHTVTSLYEVVPLGNESGDVTREVDPLKYQKPGELTDAAWGDELLTVKLRYKQPDADQSKKMVFTFTGEYAPFDSVDGDFRFASAVASFGMLLRDSKHKGNATFDSVIDIASSGLGDDSNGYRSEFIQMVKRGRALN
jgi:Ca-activated chloride channel family protein